MEAPSSHPLSAALVSAAEAEGVEPSRKLVAQHHTVLKGEGVCATVRNQRVYVGNERLFKRIEMYELSKRHLELNQQWNDEGGTTGFIGIEGLGIIAMYCVTDSVRVEAQHVVTTMINSGMKVIMLTGDGDGAAQAIGNKITLSSSDIKSQFLPEDKMHYVASLKDNSSRSAGLFRSGKDVVMMVGDGVNDAPALAIADVSVAMGQGAAMALEMSDITLMDSDLNKLLFGMKMGSKVITTVKENIVFSLITNATAVGLTFAGKMTLLLAIICDVGVMLLVTMNGMKLLSQRNIRSIEASSLKASPSSSRPRGQYEAAPSGGVDFCYEDDDGVEIV
jgi:Cd2+/Zn2+-exporting ATPase